MEAAREREARRAAKGAGSLRARGRILGRARDRRKKKRWDKKQRSAVGMIFSTRYFSFL
jgi:hypothetical protein